jgi:hypothetical protein
MALCPEIAAQEGAEGGLEGDFEVSHGGHYLLNYLISLPITY